MSLVRQKGGLKNDVVDFAGVVDIEKKISVYL